MQELLLAIAALCLCALLVPRLKLRLLRPKEMRRLVVLPVEGDCERIEQRLLYERERIRWEPGSLLFLLESDAGGEALGIARRFCEGQPGLLCGDDALLRAQTEDSVYKVVEVVLY